MHTYRLPPGQQLAAPGKWPVVGEREPASRVDDWSVHVDGSVAAPRTWSVRDLCAFPQQTRTVDLHCVTRWSILEAVFTGVPLSDLLAVVRPTPAARFVSFVAHSPRGHSTSLSLKDALELDVFLALTYGGQPLTAEHGGPVRVVTPGRYFYKSLKWLTRIELLAEDRLGFWEASAGYHNRADPQREERFIASGISKQEAARILASRDLSGKEILGLDGSDRDLAGLTARGAILRNANFRGARLPGADFSGANLSLAQFVGADLSQACLANGDLEGANFCGCDLRGTDLRGASLFGASFIQPGPAGEQSIAAILDEHTRIDASALESLMPEQAAFLRP